MDDRPVLLRRWAVPEMLLFAESFRSQQQVLGPAAWMLVKAREASWFAGTSSGPA
jgi:hypothetical protein